MAPRVVKTYFNSSKLSKTNHTTTFKKTKNKLKLKPLPKPGGKSINDSIEVELDNTFDRLLKGDVCNNVVFKKVAKNVDTSESDISKSKISLLSSIAIEQSIEKKIKKKTRKKKATKKQIVPVVKIQKPIEYSSIDVDLCIEKETRKQDDSSIQFSKSDSIVEPIFSKSFNLQYNKNGIMASTPVISTPLLPHVKKKLINDSFISPISSRNRGGYALRDISNLSRNRFLKPKTSAINSFKNKSLENSSYNASSLLSKSDVFKKPESKENSSNLDRSLTTNTKSQVLCDKINGISGFSAVNTSSKTELNSIQKSGNDISKPSILNGEETSRPFNTESDLVQNTFSDDSHCNKPYMKICTKKIDIPLNSKKKQPSNVSNENNGNESSQIDDSSSSVIDISSRLEQSSNYIGRRVYNTRSKRFISNEDSNGKKVLVDQNVMEEKTVNKEIQQYEFTIDDSKDVINLSSQLEPPSIQTEIKKYIAGRNKPNSKNILSEEGSDSKSLSDSSSAQEYSNLEASVCQSLSETNELSHSQTMDSKKLSTYSLDSTIPEDSTVDESNLRIESLNSTKLNLPISVNLTQCGFVNQLTKKQTPIRRYVTRRNKNSKDIVTEETSNSKTCGSSKRRTHGDSIVDMLEQTCEAKTEESNSQATFKGSSDTNGSTLQAENQDNSKLFSQAVVKITPIDLKKLSSCSQKVMKEKTIPKDIQQYEFTIDDSKKSLSDSSGTQEYSNLEASVCQSLSETNEFSHSQTMDSKKISTYSLDSTVPEDSTYSEDESNLRNESLNQDNSTKLSLPISVVNLTQCDFMNESTKEQTPIRKYVTRRNKNSKDILTEETSNSKTCDSSNRRTHGGSIVDMQEETYEDSNSEPTFKGFTNTIGSTLKAENQDNSKLFSQAVVKITPIDLKKLSSYRINGSTFEDTTDAYLSKIRLPLTVNLRQCDFLNQSKKYFASTSKEVAEKTDPVPTLDDSSRCPTEEELSRYSLDDSSILELSSIVHEAADENILHESQQHSMIEEEEDLIIIADDSECYDNFDECECLTRRSSYNLKPGKWRRSLLTLRRSIIENFEDEPDGASCRKCRKHHKPAVNQRSSTNSIRSNTHKRLSSKIILASKDTPKNQHMSILQTYARVTGYGGKTDTLDEKFEDLVLTPTLDATSKRLTSNLTAKDIVWKRCGQTNLIPFSTLYNDTTLKDARKLGEGVYGEVFLLQKPQKETSVIKIIPIEGNQIVNGERQKRYEEILSEIVIAQELSNLRFGRKNRTTGFSELKKTICVQGKYPQKLLQLWDAFDDEHGSENNSPRIFKSDQVYIVLEFGFAGKDMEAYVFNNAQQAYSVFKQTICALAVAETALQFEHRDMHWGNILINTVDKMKKVVFNIDGHKIEIPSHGVEVTIIDFTMSRITCDGVCIYNDLAEDPELFTADGDYQFEIYRLMQKKVNNSWQAFCPYTNVLWMHYILDKLISALRYKYISSKIHREHIHKLKHQFRVLLKYESIDKYVRERYINSLHSDSDTIVTK